MDVSTILNQSYEGDLNKPLEDKEAIAQEAKLASIWQQWQQIQVTDMFIKNTESHIMACFDEVCRGVLSDTMSDRALRAKMTEVATLDNMLKAIRNRKGKY